MQKTKTHLKPSTLQLPLIKDEQVETGKSPAGGDKLRPTPGIRVISGAWAVILLLGMLILLVLYEFLRQ